MTRDQEATRRFYEDLIGLPLVATWSEADELFTDYEQTLFTRVVAIAERHGRGVKLLVLPATNIFDAVAQTAVICPRAVISRASVITTSRWR